MREVEKGRGGRRRRKGQRQRFVEVCIRMLCSAWNTIIKLKVPEIPRGIPSEKLP
jgi:hypothetical protein